jgi:hypothetical protein
MANWTASAMKRVLTILLPSNERIAAIVIFSSNGLTPADWTWVGRPRWCSFPMLMTFAGIRAGQLFPIQRSDSGVRKS